jgi:hypothetical protein
MYMYKDRGEKESGNVSCTCTKPGERKRVVMCHVQRQGRERVVMCHVHVQSQGREREWSCVMYMYKARGEKESGHVSCTCTKPGKRKRVVMCIMRICFASVSMIVLMYFGTVLKEWNVYVIHLLFQKRVVRTKFDIYVFITRYLHQLKGY